jgi:uncharacterized protein (TIGR02246 family)
MNPAQAIADVFAAMTDAWNRADGTAFGELFTDDADFIEIRGGHHVGRTAIELGHRGLWDSIYAGSTVDYRVEAVRPLDSRSAVGVIGAVMHAPTGPLAGTNHARITAVLVEADGSWRIASFHNTLVLEVGAA